MANSESHSLKVSPTSLLEQASESKYFLLLGSLILLLDNLLVIFYNKNIIYFLKNPLNPNMTVGNAIFFLGIFSFLMAIFFPILRAVISWGIFQMICPKKKENFAYLPSLEQRALKEQNSFLLELVTEHKKKIRELMAYRNISFSFVSLLITNLVLGFMNTSSLTCYFWSFLFSSHQSSSPKLIEALAWVIGIVFIIFCITILFISLEPDSDDMYFPQ